MVLEFPLFVVDELSGCAEVLPVIPVEELEPEAGAAPVWSLVLLPTLVPLVCPLTGGVVCSVL